MKVLFTEPTNCVGCRVCELACSAGHFNCFKRTLSAIAIIKYDEKSRDVPMVCEQCEDAACAAVCTPRAINRNTKTGAWEIDYSKCIGCKLCVSACPFGQIFFDDEMKIPVKCNLCGGDPECVKVCPSATLVFDEPHKSIMHRRRHFAEKIFKGEPSPSSLKTKHYEGRGE
ncbi:MAG: 4Fe-4S dicluster domain-containing protein [Elusimicrobiota bacterium]